MKKDHQWPPNQHTDPTTNKHSSRLHAHTCIDDSIYLQFGDVTAVEGNLLVQFFIPLVASLPRSTWKLDRHMQYILWHGLNQFA